jgi:predicted GH43/DUF377 family glycosyl hydrolase
MHPAHSLSWTKKGLIFAPYNNHDWMVSHAQVPLVDRVNDEVLRIYFGTRDAQNRTVTTYIEVDATDPSQVRYIHHQPVLGLGELGCFDDAGAMPSWIIDRGHLKYLYYTGWNTSTTVPYRNSIGLAISEDGGQTFERAFKGPLLDRTQYEPHFCAVPCVLVEDDKWRMWYLSGVRWDVFDGRPEPRYHIKYAESEDGINWDRRGIICIDFKSESEAGIVRPSVIKDSGLYRMWYSYRGLENYRTDKNNSYRIGYAESEDGIDWTRKDENLGLPVSPSGWDSEMVAYPYVYVDATTQYMFYNGNGFGKSGFGYAVLA